MDEQSMLTILIGEFYDKLTRLANLVKRDIEFPYAPGKIKVAIGMRRVGKTYFVYSQILKLIESGVDKKAILFLNFEDDRLLPLDEHKLAKLVDAFYAGSPENHQRKCYLFFDEIQNVPNWPLVIRRLHDTKNAEFFLTGSSAKMLSKEIATSLRGRSLAIEVWPYSFHEFIRAKNLSLDFDFYDIKAQDLLKQAFNHYLSEGGFPEIINYDNEGKQKTLQDYLDVVIYRDIIERHHIKNPTLIKSMILSMVHNVGKPFSVNKFFNELKTRGYKIGKDLLYEYVDHIEDAYLGFFMPIYDLSFRKINTHPKKMYAIDSGMVRALTLDYENDFGRLFENMIYLDFRRLGYNINYYITSQKYEVDFLVEMPRGVKKLFQVAFDVRDPATLEREKRALESAMQELKVDGEIITLDSYLKGIIS